MNKTPTWKLHDLVDITKSCQELSPKRKVNLPTYIYVVGSAAEGYYVMYCRYNTVPS